MIIKYQFNKVTDGKLNTHWILFTSKNKNYTKQMVEAIRLHVPKLADATDEQIKGWFTGKYEDSGLSLDEEYNQYELRDSGSFSCIHKDHVQFIKIG